MSDAALVQRRLWGTDPLAWAELAESHNRPLFEAVLDAARAGRGTRVLDVGCGAGLALVLAAESALSDAGLRVTGDGEVACCWRYASMEVAVRALLCSAGGARAAEAAGEDAVREVLVPVLARFQAPLTGVVTMENTFRWLAAGR